MFHDSGQTFYSFEVPLHLPNSEVEWQANEGAAEFLVPARALQQLRSYYNLEKSYMRNAFLKIASEHFFVSKTVIEYRLQSLNL
jgi:Zn-dependent peptidase ImmA (M78 family)